MSIAAQVGNAETSAQTSIARLGRWTALLLALLAATAFACGIASPPRSGPFCTGQCMAYPYTDAVQFVPRDYLWVVPSILLTPLFVVLIACVHARVRVSKRPLTLISLCFSSISAAIITLDYFIQFEVVEPSLMKGEINGLALFTQYNPHGFFIALEDLGYLMLSVAFLFACAALGRSSRLEFALQLTFFAAATLAFSSFIGMSWHFGFNLEYRFEVAIITITWAAMIALGVMLVFFFKRPSQSDFSIS